MNPVNEFVTASCTDWSNMDLKPATPGLTDGDGVVVPGVVVELEDVPSVGSPLLVPGEAMSMTMSKKKDSALKLNLHPK